MENAGLYQKYLVTRRDGKPAPVYYFVLDVLNDSHARAALSAYAQSCSKDLPLLADDLRALEAELAAGRRDGPRLLALATPRS